MKNITVKPSITNRDRDSVNLYLKDISHIKLLTPEQETEIARKAKNGDKRARDKLISANTRFVVTVAKQYQGQGLDLEDLIAEGNIGLIRAAERFDPDKGFRFISYAVWWIKQAILQSLSDKSRTIRLPLSQVQMLNKIRKTTADFVAENEREPSMGELAELTGIPEHKINAILNVSSKMISVDSPLKEDEEGTFIDVIPNNNSPKSDSIVMKEANDKELEMILSRLGPRNHDIVRMYFGLGCTQQTLEQIGEKFGIHSERARQLKEESLKIIKDRAEKYLK